MLEDFETAVPQLTSTEGWGGDGLAFSSGIQVSIIFVKKIKILFCNA